jgi:hypothetical protein
MMRMRRGGGEFEFDMLENAGNAMRSEWEKWEVNKEVIVRGVLYCIGLLRRFKEASFLRVSRRSEL